MNLGHALQSLLASLEGLMIMSFDNNLVGSESNANMAGAVQDALLCPYILTGTRQLLTRKQFERLCKPLHAFQHPEMDTNRRKTIPPPAVFDSITGEEKWTTKQVFEMLLPTNFNYDRTKGAAEAAKPSSIGGISGGAGGSAHTGSADTAAATTTPPIIRNGQLISGVITGEDIGLNDTSIIKRLGSMPYTMADAARFLNDLLILTKTWFMGQVSSISLVDQVRPFPLAPLVSSFFVCEFVCFFPSRYWTLESDKKSTRKWPNY